jgi:uncharacterized membrane protein
MKKLLSSVRPQKAEVQAMTLESNKTMGGVGALLLLIGTLPLISTFTFGVIAIIGVILLFIALHGFASQFHEGSIFTNAIYGLVIGIVGVVITVAVAFYLLLYTTLIKNALMDLFPSWNGSWSTLPSIAGTTPNTSMVTSVARADLIGLVEAAIVIIAVAWIFATIAAFFVRRSLKTMAVKTGTGLFATAGLVLLIGALLLIAFVLPGLVVIYIALIILTAAFFSVKAEQIQQQTVTPPTAPSTPTPV